jgi:predicted enzyme related to lactoylglutathione lyase
MNPVVHFEIPAADSERISNFYNQAFGWQIQMLGPEMNNYVLATTSPSDDKGTPTQPGQINGGFFQKSDDKPAQYPSVVIDVEDIHEAMKKVNEAGGQVIGEPVEIPGVGTYVSFYDTEGNRNSIMQSIRR